MSVYVCNGPALGDSEVPPESPGIRYTLKEDAGPRLGNLASNSFTSALEPTAIWVRERHRNKRTRQQSEVVHSHLLFHLPPRHRAEARKDMEDL